MFCLDKRNIRVAVSQFCTLNCVYCDGPQGRKTGKPGAMEDFRDKPLPKGVISTAKYLEIIKALSLAGFVGMTLTGGEPLLNKDWDVIVNEAKKMGMKRVGLTTNGTLLNSYLQKHKHLPKGLTLLTISFDAIDPLKFKEITRVGNLEEVIKGLKAAKKDNPKLIIRANKVLLKSNLQSLDKYIKFCQNSGFIDEINLLNLILKEPQNEKCRQFFKEEFISTEKAIEYLIKHLGLNFIIDPKYEFETQLPDGLRIIIKDTNQTMRNSLCGKCPIYCQEGFYTVRVGTDGSIRTCIDYKSELPFIDGPLELQKGLLNKKVKSMVKIFGQVKKKNTLNTFFKRYDVKPSSL